VRAALILVLVLAACADAPDLSPLGNWQTTNLWTAGDCGFEGSAFTDTETVSVTADGSFVIAGSAEGGVVACDPISCALSGSHSGIDSYGGEFTATINLTLDQSSRVTGGGRLDIAFLSGGACWQIFAVQSGGRI